MSISQIIEKYHKNRVENIKKMSNGIDRDMAIGSFVADDEQIERTANENQKVLKEITIDDVYEVLKENNVKFIEYKDKTCP